MVMDGVPTVIRGTGSYAPSRVLRNEDLTGIVDTTDEWIVTRTGIRERRIAAEDEATSDLAVPAARAAMEMAGLGPEDIDAVIVCTLTPDMLFPSTACLVQSLLGLRRGIPAFDVDAACSGFVYGLESARGLLAASRKYRNVLLVGAEKLSAILDWTDRSTCVLFGDGAGAIVLTRGEEGPGGHILATDLGSDGVNSGLIHMPAGGSRVPASPHSLEGRQHFLKMNGREVFKLAVRAMVASAERVLEEAGVSPQDLVGIIPHQANIRIIESVAQYLKLPLTLFPNNVHLYGNTSAASVPLAFDEAIRAGKLSQPGPLLLIAFGAGLTWGSTLLHWEPLS